MGSGDDDGTLESCVAECDKTCLDNDLKKGCNMQYSCAHACKIRDLGVTEASCKLKCVRNFPGSGCYPVVNGYQFNLCVECKNRGELVADPAAGQCAYENQKRIAECASGCTFYNKM